MYRVRGTNFESCLGLAQDPVIYWDPKSAFAMGDNVETRG